MSKDLSGFSMDELFAMEAETQCAALSDGLVALEANPASPDVLATLMRAAHSLKGAGRIVGRDDAVKVAHAMEDCFVLGQKGELRFTAAAIDLMLRGVDLLKNLAAGDPDLSEAVERYRNDCAAVAAGTLAAPPSPPKRRGTPPAESPTASGERGVQTLRVDAKHLDHVLGFAGEGLVAARQLETFLADFRRLGHLTRDLAARLASVKTGSSNDEARLRECRGELAALESSLLDRHSTLDAFSRRWNRQADRLYQEALACRMRPLEDILPGLRRLVRDLSRQMERPADLEVIGEDTPVDREILERLEAPLTHLLRNALDHGIESPDERLAAGKPERGKITVEARHIGGQLTITIGDDGRGLDLPALRARIVARGFADERTAAALTEVEAVDFLFLPGFSMRDTVTEISGRGVGLDVVQSMARAARGSVRAAAHPRRGLSFELRLPISLSVLRSLLVRIAGEPFAFPLAHLERALRIPVASIESAEGRQFFTWNDERVSLASAAHILGLGDSAPPGDAVCVLLLANQGRTYGLAVDAFLGEQDLVVQPLDPALGKVPGISSASLDEAGAPLLVADTGDFALAMERLAAEAPVRAVPTDAAATAENRRRILVVEDSLTVRELERKLLREQGYDVEVAFDGMDGWTALRNGGFDLLLTDIDMPRMDGIELTRLVKSDPRLRDTPVMIVSYKDREEDRRRGLDAGADYYLTKGSFQDRTLITAVRDLIGDPA